MTLEHFISTIKQRKTPTFSHPSSVNTMLEDYFDRQSSQISKRTQKIEANIRADFEDSTSKITNSLIQRRKTSFKHTDQIAIRAISNLEYILENGIFHCNYSDAGFKYRNPHNMTMKRFFGDKIRTYLSELKLLQDEVVELHYHYRLAIEHLQYFKIMSYDIDP